MGQQQQQQYIGNYRIVRQLGAGGMGLVYEGIHRHLERRVAIKVLHRQYSEERDALSRFFLEARAANLAQHPSIVDVYEFGFSDDGRAYIAMEFIAGVSLKKRLSDAGRLGTLCLPWVRELAAALAVAHERGVVHRDLKPENVMLVPSVERPGHERVKILDFGLAKVLRVQPADLPIQRNPTQTGMVMGTPAYMPPEQARGDRDVGQAADVYSLGIMLYEMLSGRLPFERDNPFEIVLLHMFANPPLLRQVAPAVPRPLASLVQSMMDKDPAKRPTMEKVARELARLAHLDTADVPEAAASAARLETAKTATELPSSVIRRLQPAAASARKLARGTAQQLRSFGAAVIMLLLLCAQSDRGISPLPAVAQAAVIPLPLLPGPGLLERAVEKPADKSVEKPIEKSDTTSAVPSAPVVLQTKKAVPVKSVTRHIKQVKPEPAAQPLPLPAAPTRQETDDSDDQLVPPPPLHR